MMLLPDILSRHHQSLASLDTCLFEVRTKLNDENLSWQVDISSIQKRNWIVL